MDRAHPAAQTTGQSVELHLIWHSPWDSPGDCPQKKVYPMEHSGEQLIGFSHPTAQTFEQTMGMPIERRVFHGITHRACTSHSIPRDTDDGNAFRTFVFKGKARGTVSGIDGEYPMGHATGQVLPTGH